MRVVSSGGVTSAFRSCVEFYSLNKDIIREHAPWAFTCDCNAFVVPAGASSQAYGLHHASSFPYQDGAYHKRKWLMVKRHASFHTAVTETTEGGGYRDGHRRRGIARGLGWFAEGDGDDVPPVPEAPAWAASCDVCASSLAGLDRYLNCE